MEYGKWKIFLYDCYIFMYKKTQKNKIKKKKFIVVMVRRGILFPNQEVPPSFRFFFVLWFEHFQLQADDLKKLVIGDLKKLLVEHREFVERILAEHLHMLLLAVHVLQDMHISHIVESLPLYLQP